MRQFDKIIIQLRRSLLYALAVFVVTAAVALSVARIFLPEVQGYKEGIEQKLGEFIEQNVQIDEVDARLIGFTPTIIFKGVHLIDDSGVKELIAFKEAHLGIAVFQSLLQRTLVPSDFSIVGTVISVLQRQDGGYSIQGFDISGLDTGNGFDAKISEELAHWLLEQASISIKDSVVVWKQKNHKTWYRFENVNAVLHNRAERHQLTGSFEPPQSMGEHSRIAMDVRGDLLEPEKWQGLVYVNCKGTRISNLGIQPEIKGIKVRDGIADYELWGEWAEGGFRHLAGEVAVQGMELENTKTGKMSSIDTLNGRFDWQGDLSDWKLRIDQLEFVTQGSAWKQASVIAGWRQSEKDKSEFSLGLSYAKIDDVKNLLLKSGLYNGRMVEMLGGLDPTGEISNLDIDYIQRNKGKDSYRLNMDVENLGFKAWRHIPGIYGLNARISLNDTSGRFRLDGRNVILNSPGLFRQSIALDDIAGDFYVHNSGNGWVLQSNDFAAKNADFNLALGLMLMLPDNKKSPYLDLQMALREVNIAGIYKYQPARLMKEKLVAWIDNSFKSGRAPEINFVFRGWSNDFPFRQYAGVLNGDFVATGVAMDYFPGWPGLDGLEAKGEFTERGILVRSDKAGLYNGKLTHLTAGIDDFKRPILRVSGDADSTTHDGFHFFAKTPVGIRAERFVSQTRFAGDIHTHLTFSVALDKDLAKQYKRRFDGYVETANSAMYLMHEQMDVTEIKGRLYFSDKKYHGEGITAKILQGKAGISVSSRMVGVKPVMELMGEGSFDAVMLDRRMKKLGMMRISGQLPWKGKLILGYQKPGSEAWEPARMWIKSDLVGVAIDLPEPFYKAAETSRHTEIHTTFLPDLKTVLSVQYGDRVSTAMRLNNFYFPARIEIGEMKLSAGKAKLPDKNEFRLSGVVNNLDQYGWRDVMQEHYDKYKKLSTRPIVEVPVVVDFAYVSVPFDKTRTKLRKRYTSPLVIPAFNGQVRRFVFAGKDIGKLEFDSRRDRRGLAFDKFRVTSTYMELNGKGTWHYVNDRHETRIQATLKSQNFGKLMANIGFPDKMEGGDGKVSVDLHWGYPFYVFQPAYTNGTVKVSVEDGVVKAINPGAGRFLGLLNLSTLPRRLLLDFDDVGSGFGFDKITGNITLKNGTATTDDLAVDSTVADILAVGRVDLRKKELDQIVTVTPQVAGTMPVVSGLLMGTGVIPLVWLFERMFGSDMDKSMSRQYHISGPWDKPKVERIDKEDDSEQTPAG